MSLRVVAGSVRGRRLATPPGASTRPTSDRVREAMFNALASLGVIEGATVLDLFAGSGALAIEALSRGADRAVLVETDRTARGTITENLQQTGFTERSEVVAGEALAHLTRTSDTYDLVLADPPYRFDDWPRLLEAVTTRLGPGAVLVVESDGPVTAVPPLVVIREKRYGSTVVSFSRSGMDAAP